jgi:hypothetical protein
MPNLDWDVILTELGRANFHFPDLERFNFLASVYRAAGKSSSFTLGTLLVWPDFTARFSAVRILIRVPKDIFDVLEQSENLVMTADNFANAGAGVKEKAMVLAQQNLNSLDLCQAFFLLNDINEDPQAIPILREEFRNNVELLTLAGAALPVFNSDCNANKRNRGRTQPRTSSIAVSSISFALKELINSSSPAYTKSILLSLQKHSSNTLLAIHTASHVSVT